MSRNKENKLLPSQTRANGSVFGQVKAPSGGEFFTDSLLDDTSRIPSPSPVKSRNVASNQRRAFKSTRPLQASRSTVNTANRSSSPSNGKSRQQRKHLQPAPVLTRPSNFNSSQQELITPPQSRDGPAELKSPTSDVSSPPRGLTEVYQRIDDEEELAAAEREGGSSEEGSDMALPVDGQSPIRPIKNGVSRRSDSSRASTPVRGPRYPDKENRLDDITGTLSEGTGVSFLKGLTDQNIAASLTPAVSSHMKDMKKMGISAKPITFNPGIKPSERFANDALDLERKPAIPKPKAFTLAGKVNGHRTGKAHSDTSIEERPRSQAFKLAGLASHQPVPPPQEEDEDDGQSTDEELRRREKLFSVNRIVKRIGSKSPEKGLNGVNSRNLPLSKDPMEATGENAIDDETGSVNLQSNQSEPSLSRIPTRNAMPVMNRGVLDRWRRTSSEAKLQRAPSFTSQASSIVDWGAVDEEMPIPSIEQQESDTPQVTPSRSEAPGSIRSQNSVDRLKRWENDFTGTSFQVSESPPVKSRKNVGDYVRESEIARLSKSAVTTNRLDAIRERDPREAHRRLSKSQSGTSLRKDAKDEEPTIETELEPAGERIPDTPVVVFRSSSGGQKEFTKPNAERPSHDRSTPHDLMQRLSRLSTTPRSSPAPLPKEAEAPQQTPDLQDEPTQDTYPSSVNAPEVQQETVDKKATVAATPKVTGAWTDTIFPDTIRTVKQREREKEPSKYAQTPHVNAGGWIETPMPTGRRQSSAMAPMILEEMTEELDTDVVSKQPTEAAKPNQPKDQSAAPVEMESNPEQAVRLPRSAWASIRNQQAQLRIASQDITDAIANDTLVLGDATLASLDEALDLTDRDVTALIRMGAEQEARQQQNGNPGESDTIQLDRLYSKLQALQTNIHTARTGISKLEKEVAKDPSSGSFLQQELFDLMAHLPQQPFISFSPLALFVPLLFHPPKQKSRLRPLGKPTPLGYKVLSVVAYYLLECFLSELFCHPLLADRYSWPSHAHGEPSFGLVMPTLLLRLVGVGRTPSFGAFGDAVWAVVVPVYTLLRAFYRVLAMWIGWTDGFVDDAKDSAVRNASQVVQKVAETVGAGRGWNMNMDEDEFI